MREFQFCKYQTLLDTLKDEPNLHCAWRFFFLFLFFFFFYYCRSTAMPALSEAE